MTHYIIDIRDGDSELVAAGSDPQNLQVFRVEGRSLIPLEWTFPDCLRWIPYAETSAPRRVNADTVSAALRSRGRVRG